MLCITLQAAGQIVPARRLAERLHEVDPLSPFSGAMLCAAEWFAGNVGHHLEAMERSRAMDPENPIVNWAPGYTYAMMGRIDGAARRAEWRRTHVPDLPCTVQLSSLVDAIEGRREDALDAHHTFHIAEVYAMAGETERVLALLERAVDHGMYPHKFYTECCPFTVPLRGHPEFGRIVAKAARRAAAFDA